MFDYSWCKKNKISKIRLNIADRVVPTIWSEHCIECAAPSCYNTCSLYKYREDGQCIRVDNGIEPIIKEKEIYNTKVCFRKWGKIECLYNCRTISIEKCVDLYNIINKANYCGMGITRRLPGRRKKWIIMKGIYSVRQKSINKILEKKGKKENNLGLFIQAKSKDTRKLIVEMKSISQVLWRKDIKIANEFETQIIEIPKIDSSENIFLGIYPENVDKDNVVEFKSLELISFAEKNTKPNKKVKLVIWDLDNTIWDGILIETNVTLRKDIIHIIRTLDAQGIVNSISSKNDNEQALKKLQEFDILDYFVFPKINWNAKSININETIKEMNISADTVVFVDDSPFERDEVHEHIEGIRVVDVKDINDYVLSSEFKGEITLDAKNRRNTYHMLEQQKKDLKTWDGDYDNFLRSCEMKLFVGKPFETELERCCELLQRTNQLNASGRRLEKYEVEFYWKSTDFRTYALFCEDKYGSYGQVGFAIEKINSEVNTITDFVISCRVANKKVEHAFIKYLADKSKNKKIRICYKKTERNGPIFNVVKDMNMKKIEDDSQDIYEYISVENGNGIVKVFDR